MRLWTVPDPGEQGTELVVMAKSRDAAIALAREWAARVLAEHPSNVYALDYDEIEEIEPPYYVPMYGYSW